MDTERTNDKWLKALRGAGRQEALDDLRRRLVRGLGYALSNVPPADLEDFAQEALLKVLDNLDSFRGESRFTTWAQKIAVRVAFTELRRRRWKDVPLADLLPPDVDGDLTPAVLTDPAPSPEQRATQGRLLETVHRLITEDLTNRQRQAIVATKIQGMSLEEVARRMGTNRNALYKLIHDARQRLKDRMLAQGLSPQEVLAAFEDGETLR